MIDKINQQEREKYILKRYKEDLTKLSDIGKELDVSRQMVWKIIKRNVSPKERQKINKQRSLYLTFLRDGKGNPNKNSRR